MPSEAAASPQSRTALVSIAAATLLVLLKLVTGILTGSLGLISAGIESSGDVVAAVMTFFAIRLGGRPPPGRPPRRRGPSLRAPARGEPRRARRGRHPLRRWHLHRHRSHRPALRG